MKKYQTMRSIFIIAVLTLLLCACLAGCASPKGRETASDAQDAIEQPDIAPPSVVPSEEDGEILIDAPAPESITADTYIERLTNSNGGILNIYYTIQESSGEAWPGVIHFDPNGGETPDEATMTWNADKRHLNLACPFVREGYAFLGWSLDRSGNPYILPTNDHFAAYPISEIVALAEANDKTGDLTFYAIWGQNLIITYDTNQPSAATETVTGMPAHNPAVWEYGQSVVLAQGPSLAGWRFEGWYQDATCQTKAGDAGEILPSNRNIQGNVRLYAKWVENTYKVTYYENKPVDVTETVTGMPTQNPAVWEYGQSVVLAQAPSLTGWRFEGWYQDAACQTKVGDGGEALPANHSFEGDVSLFAKWVENTYKVTYYENKPESATGAVTGMPAHNPAVWEYGQSVVLAQTPSLTGWRFEGWYQDAACQAKVGDGGEALPANHSFEGNVSLYAKWVESTYKVTYYENKPESATKSVTGMPTQSQQEWKYDQNATLAGAPSLTGWKFLGWYRDATCQIKLGDAEEVLEKPNLVESGQVSLFAKWEAEQYKVTFNATANGGYCEIDYRMVRYDGRYGALPEASRAESRFLGWFTQPEGGTKVEADTLVELEEDQVLYAQFERVPQYTTLPYKGPFDYQNPTYLT